MFFILVTSSKANGIIDSSLLSLSLPWSSSLCSSSKEPWVEISIQLMLDAKCELIKCTLFSHYAEPKPKWREQRRKQCTRNVRRHTGRIITSALRWLWLPNVSANRTSANKRRTYVDIYFNSAHYSRAHIFRIVLPLAGPPFWLSNFNLIKRRPWLVSRESAPNAHLSRSRPEMLWIPPKNYNVLIFKVAVKLNDALNPPAGQLRVRNEHKNERPSPGSDVQQHCSDRYRQVVKHFSNK